MNKKASHVGIVLSFVVFVTFLIFLYSVLEPSFKSGEDKENILDSLEKQLIEEFSSELITVLISTDGGEDCVNVDLGELVLGDNFIVKNKDDLILGSSFVSGNLEIDSDESFFRAYFSEEEFESRDFSGDDCVDVDVGSVLIEEYIFKSLAGKFIADFENNDLNIPEENNVGIIFKDDSGAEIFSTGIGDGNSEVYVREIPIQYIDDQANINSGVINIIIW